MLSVLTCGVFEFVFLKLYTSMLSNHFVTLSNFLSVFSKALRNPNMIKKNVPQMSGLWSGL